MAEDQQQLEGEKLIMDLAWERQQKKTFTAWCNSHLRKRKLNIEEIDQDFRSGLKLLALLEIISDEKLGKPEKGKMRVHHVSNVNMALNFIKSQGVRLVGIGAEEIVDGNLKMTLGMIWTVILRFSIQDISVEESSAKEGLLLWCQKKTAPYKNVKVQNFHMSWKDGLAFCALIHRHRPDLIPNYESLSKEDPRRNLETAFEVAEKHLDIPRMLDPEDLIDIAKPDERAVMTYVSCYYHAFSGAQKAEQAANRINQALRAHQENEELMDKYEKLASDLLEWIENTKPTLENRTSDNTMEDLQKKLEDFRDYRRTQKPPKAEEKGQLESIFNTLQTKLRLSNRPAYMPSEGKLVSDIASAWKGLEGAEKGYEEWLLSEMRRLESLEHLAKKFHHRVAVHKGWAEGKHEVLNSDDYKECTLQQCKALLKKHEAFESDYAAHSERVEQIDKIAEELNKLHYYDADTIVNINNEVKQDWETLSTEMDQRTAALKEKEAELEELENQCLEYAKRAGKLNNWMLSAMEDMEDTHIVHSIDECNELIVEHEAFTASIGDAENEKNSIMEYSGTAADPETGNHYTSVSPNEIEQNWGKLVELSEKRKLDLEEELKVQTEHEKLRVHFAELANASDKWMQEQNEKCRTISLSSSGSLEETLETLQKHLESIEERKPDIEEMETTHQAINLARIYDNPHTALTMEHIRTEWDHLRSTCGRTINEVENQILLRDALSLSEDQIKEFRASFDHFDKDRSGKLEKSEFRGCLLSLGHDVDSKQPKGDENFDKIWKEVDPNGMEYVTFEAFMDFMAKDVRVEDTAAQVTDSFRVLAGDKPYILPNEIRRELPPDQAEYCISRMSKYTGGDAPDEALDYESFSSGLYGESDL
ncbi:alpha-actinin-1-like [Styela clava]|uniref:alpha-actinin-1-like n=1 Tax=Styela clava TaxID=7725 RepID=UPI00193986CB|nr:alpha-actinin-1-like [Styela clava]